MRFVFHAIVEWKYVNRTRIASLLISHLVCCGMVLYLTVGYWGGRRVAYEIDLSAAIVYQNGCGFESHDLKRLCSAHVVS